MRRAAALRATLILVGDGDGECPADPVITVVWTINDPTELEDVFRAGVHMIITGEPDLLEQTRAGLCLDFCRT